MSIKSNPTQCYYCKHKERCTKDHFYPKSQGGKITVYACSICQFSKKNLHPFDWVKYINSHSAITDTAKKEIEKNVLILHNYLQSTHINFGALNILNFKS